jgi:nonsense-mediated mRNA decay protein 3
LPSTLILLTCVHRSKGSEQLLSTDTHSGTSQYKFTYSVEIIPVCKDDLVCLPIKQAKQLSNINPLVLCTRIGNSLQLLDPSTLQTCEVTAPVYWRTPFNSLATVSDLKEFTVLDIEPSGPTRGKHVLADAQVALSGAFTSGGTAHTDEDSMDYESSGSTDQIYHTRTHLGGILQPGDTVLGYHLSHTNFNSDEFSALPSSRVPDVVLVKKTYPNRRKKNKARNWKLRSIAKEAGEEGETSAARGVVGRLGGRDQRKVEEDYELFLRDLEEDPEMRGMVNLYKAADVQMDSGSGLAGGKTRKKAQFAMEVDDHHGAAPAATVEEPASTEEEQEEEEPDFPEVQLHELLEHFDELALGEEDEEHHEP